MDESTSPVPDLNWEKYIKAGHHETAVEQLWLFAVDDHHRVRRRVAENPICPEDILRALSIDEHVDVRIAVAEHPNTPCDVLIKLSNDENGDLRYALAENPNMPVELISRLTEDDNPYVCHRALRTLRSLQPASIAEFKLRPTFNSIKYGNKNGN
jgi:hypothetical protein